MTARWTVLVPWRTRAVAVASVISARRSSSFGAFWQGAFVAVLGLAMPWLWLGPGLWEESDQLEQQGQKMLHEQVQGRAKIQALQAQLLPSESPSSPAASPSGQAAGARLMLHRLALQYKVHLELLKSSGDGASRAGFASPAPAASQGPTADKHTGLRVQLRGSYGALLGFMRAMGDSGPLWSLKQLHLEAGSQQAHRLSLVLEALPGGLVRETTAARPTRASGWRGVDPFAAPVAAPVAPARESEPPALKDPLADVPEHWRPEFLRERQPLEAMPLRDLIFAGTLRQGAAWVALMRGRDAVHTVKVGDYLGPDLGRVQQIDEDGLELRELRRDGSGRWSEHLRRWRVGGAP